MFQSQKTPLHWGCYHVLTRCGHGPQTRNERFGRNHGWFECFSSIILGIDINGRLTVFPWPLNHSQRGADPFHEGGRYTGNVL